MNQKIWFLGEDNLDEFPDMDATVALGVGPDLPAPTVVAKIVERNPATAFSLSLLVWGGGQYYLGFRRSAAICLVMMILFWASIPVLVYFQNAIGLAQPTLLWSVMMVALLGQLVWMINAADAYFRACRMLEEPFLGTDRKIWPVCASSILPGWGQFLNGQPIKGCCFLLFTLAGISSVIYLFAVRQLFPLFAAPADLWVFEICLLVALSLIPVFFLTWIVSAYDAFRSCEEFVRHKQRSQMAGFRLKGRELLADFVPQCSAVLGLLLAISLGMHANLSQFYLDYLKHLRVAMLHGNLTLIPELLHKILDMLSWQA